MTTTGYLVMGWQTDDSTGKPEIVKDTVSPLRVMQAANLTSAPEATTMANFSGVCDKNDPQYTASQGYIRAFTFYDNLGYSYTAKFSIKLEDDITGRYSISLANVLDSDNHDILDDFLKAGHTLDEVFGGDNTDPFTKDYTPNGEFQMLADGSFTYGGVAVTYNPDTKSFESAGGGQQISLAQALGIGDSSAVLSLTQSPDDPTKIRVTFAASTLQFDTKIGNLIYAGNNGQKRITMHSSLLGPNRSGTDPTNDNQAISDIEIDFSNLMAYDNGGTSTVVANRGDIDGTTGTGKKLGTMTGLSVSNDGKIYGKYSNGNTVLLGQIAVAQFPNASGLEEVGDNCYKTTLNSGEFDGIGMDISADGSAMNTGQLEMANVDLSAEFTDMITTQRGFQANSRIITVSDTMLEELINLKR